MAATIQQNQCFDIAYSSYLLLDSNYEPYPIDTGSIGIYAPDEESARKQFEHDYGDVFYITKVEKLS